MKLMVVNSDYDELKKLHKFQSQFKVVIREASQLPFEIKLDKSLFQGFLIIHLTLCLRVFLL